MESLYIGVDIAGSKNTWVCLLYEKDKNLYLKELPLQQKLSSIVNMIKEIHENNIRAACIDAQLTWSIFDSNDNADAGFRISDKYLKSELSEYQSNISSQNSLLAVPVRGRQLAEYLRVFIPTIIETHPTINLIFSNIFKTETKTMISSYKKSIYNNAKYFEIICKEFNIDYILKNNSIHDGIIDSLICAYTAYLIINRPNDITNLTNIHDSKYHDLRGFAPFIVFKNKRK